jgi:hypothetical protein
MCAPSNGIDDSLPLQLLRKIHPGRFTPSEENESIAGDTELIQLAGAAWFEACSDKSNWAICLQKLDLRGLRQVPI